MLHGSASPKSKVGLRKNVTRCNTSWMVRLSNKLQVQSILKEELSKVTPEKTQENAKKKDQPNNITEGKILEVNKYGNGTNSGSRGLTLMGYILITLCVSITTTTLILPVIVFKFNIQYCS